jgi:hypothetical protein
MIIMIMIMIIMIIILIILTCLSASAAACCSSLSMAPSQAPRLWTMDHDDAHDLHSGEGSTVVIIIIIIIIIIIPTCLSASAAACCRSLSMAPSQAPRLCERRPNSAIRRFSVNC